MPRIFYYLRTATNFYIQNLATREWQATQVEILVIYYDARTRKPIQEFYNPLFCSTLSEQPTGDIHYLAFISFPFQIPFESITKEENQYCKNEVEALRLNNIWN